MSASSVLRLGLIPLLGFEVWNLVVYDTLVIAVTQFHHADISLGRWDRWLRWLIVTPDMHKVHHSDRQRGNRLELFHGAVSVGPARGLVPHAVGPEDAGVRAGGVSGGGMADPVGHAQDTIREDGSGASVT